MWQYSTNFKQKNKQFFKGKNYSEKFIEIFQIFTQFSLNFWRETFDFVKSICEIKLTYIQIERKKITKIYRSFDEREEERKKKGLRQTRKILKKWFFFQRKILRISTIFSNFKQSKQFSQRKILRISKEFIEIFQIFTQFSLNF